MNKKIYVILTLCFSVLTLSMYAQGKVATSQSFVFKLGLKAGLNLANISTNSSDISFAPGMKTDFHAGIVGNFHFGYRNEGSPAGTGLFGLQPELLYSRQGFTLNSDKYNFDYITLPVMLKLYIVKDVYIEAGPYFSYLFGVSPVEAAIDNAQIKLDDLKGGLDAGAGFGAGFELTNGLTIGARYMLGLSAMAKNLAWKNNVITLSLGWLF